MWNNFSLALTTLMGIMVACFAWSLVILFTGDSVPLAQVDRALAIRSLSFSLAAFLLVCIVAYLPIRRGLIIRLLIGAGLILLGALQELMLQLVISPWTISRWLELLCLPAGTLILCHALFQLGKAYQLNRLLLGSYRKIEHNLATVDQLTQLYNRRYFFSVCPDLMHALDQRNGTPGAGPAVVLLKLVNLPEINHSLGFAVGDNVLSHTGRSILRHLRAQDISARLSGRTFAIFLPDASQREAEELALRLEELTRHLLVKDQEGRELPCFLDFHHIALSAQPGESFEQLLSRIRTQFLKRHTPAGQRARVTDP